MPSLNSTQAAPLPLSIAERDRRWSMVREYMRTEGLDALLVHGTDMFFAYGMANVRYLANVGSHTGAILIFPLEGEPTLFSLPPHQNVPFNPYVKSQDWVKDIRPFDGMPDVIAELKARHLTQGALGLVGFQSGLVASTIPYLLYKQLEDSLPKLNIRDVTGIMARFRMIKSQEEIDYLYKAGELARECLFQMWESAEPGVTEAKVYADMLSSQIVNGGEPHTFIFLSSGPVDDSKERNLLHPIDPPLSPSTRVLKKGDLLITELHANYGGYLAAAEFSIFLGDAPKELLQIHEVQVECFHRYLEVMKPGNTVREVLEAVRKPCERAGLDYIELGFHGHGLASPEFPAVVYKPGFGAADGRDIMDVVLEENMVFGTNIDIHNPSWSKHIGLMLGDMILVTQSGGKQMTNTPTELFVKK